MKDDNRAKSSTDKGLDSLAFQKNASPPGISVMKELGFGSVTAENSVNKHLNVFMSC